MKHKFWSGLSVRMMAMALLMCVLLPAVVLYVCCDQYTAQLMDYYESLGSSLTRALAEQLSDQELDVYLDEEKIDDRFAELNTMVDTLRSGSGVDHVYVVRPDENGFPIVLESAVIPGTDFYRNSYDGLGHVLELAVFPLTREQAMRGETFAPFRDDDATAGLLITAGTPVFRTDGAFSGYYVMVDIVLEQVMQNVYTFVRGAAVLVAAAAAVLLVICLLLIRRYFVQPVSQLAAAARSYAEGENKRAFSGLSFKGGYELNELADTFRLMLAEIEVNNLERLETAIQEQKLESDTRLANGLKSAMRPKTLPQRKAPYPFQVCGGVRCREGLACCFYDYFLLDGERLCVLIGEVPGEGLTQALYAVIAQTTLKSHLRSGLSLDQAMSAANRQLYETGGGGLRLNVLAGVLDGVTGRFSCVNAGEQTPLLLRFREERYDWADVFSYAPLGQNENVAYSTRELDLNQGDRLFFYTANLAAISGESGGTFGRERLRPCLNELQVRQADLDQQLQRVGDDGGAFAVRSGEVKAFAMLALEYCRRDRAQAHCLLTGDAAGSAALTEFLRGQLQANRVSQREAAQLLVMGDELFALCRAVGQPDARFMAEFTVSGEEDLVVLRIRGAMGGRDPLDVPEKGAFCGAADFVRRSCDRVLFEPGGGGDAVIAVKRVGPGQETGAE